MTDTEKKLLQAAAPIGGSAGAGSCQGAQSQNAQAHSGGCNSGKDAARGTDDGTVCTGGLPDTEAAAARLNSAGRSPEAGGLPLFLPKGALTHHPKGQWYFLRKSCALRGGCGFCGSLQTMPQPLRVLLSSSAQVAVVSTLETVCSLPAQTCHRQLCLRL